MGKRVAWTLRWSSGLGRQSGLLTLNAIAIVAIPFLYGVRPCQGAACTTLWDRLFFVPNLLFIPAIAAAFWLWGSWQAQRRHARFERRLFASMEAQEVPEIPPGHVRPPGLERDLARRTLRWTAFGALLASIGLTLLGGWNGIGRRRCDPVNFSWETGIPPCATASEWVDALVAFQVWGFAAFSFLAALVLLQRVRRYREPRPGGVRRKLGRTAKLG